MIFLTFWPSKERKRNAQLLPSCKKGRGLLSVNKLFIKQPCIPTSSSADCNSQAVTSLKHRIGEHCQVQKTLTNPTDTWFHPGESFSILTSIIFPRAGNQSMLNIDNNGGAGASIDTKSTQHWYTFMHTSFIKQKTLPKVSHQNIQEYKKHWKNLNKESNSSYQKSANQPHLLHTKLKIWLL